ncbi:hypothetical protein AVEN_198019-1 [Araneus ventricosus]|uniref:Uncharacterized protein n=1 Tax=Araneus ventricosus TaxID=182803 RepID=A0A4Y2KM20_ARAVE|nr:hypothetical protein AVEN_198019-1 [Araneus ventricosus]
MQLFSSISVRKENTLERMRKLHVKSRPAGEILRAALDQREECVDPLERLGVSVCSRAEAEKETERLRKLLAEIETDEDPDFDNEGNGHEDVLEDIFSDHENFCEHNMESEKDGDSGNEDVNNLELFPSKEGTEYKTAKFRRNIRCQNIVSR